MAFSADINVTPMIDILLVLLIIFLVVAPITSRGLDTKVPQPAHVSPTRNDAVVLTVTGGTTVQVNQDTVALTDLNHRLTSIFRNRASAVILVRGDANLEFRQIASVIDIAKGAGADPVALMR